MREHLVIFVDPQDLQPLQRAQKTVGTFIEKYQSLVADKHISFTTDQARFLFDGYLQKIRQVKIWIDEELGQ